MQINISSYKNEFNLDLFKIIKDFAFGEILILKKFPRVKCNLNSVLGTKRPFRAGYH
jgi:hypothetical protein